VIITNDFEKSSDAGHRVSINLAHVPTAVSLARVFYVQGPCPVAAVGHCDPVILRNNVIRYRQNRLRIDSQPRYLQHKSRPIKWTRSFELRSDRVGDGASQI